MLLIPVGNVTADTELTYEYGVRTEKNRPAQTSTVAAATDEDEDTPRSKGTATIKYSSYWLNLYFLLAKQELERFPR